MHKWIKQSLMIIMCVSVLIGCVSCEKRKSETGTDGVSIVKGDGEISASFFAFDTYMSISVREGNNGGGLTSEAQLKQVVEEVGRLEKIFSTTDPEAEIYKLNHREHDEVGISGEAAELLGFAREIYERSGGALDVTAYPLVKAWGFTTGKYRIPDKTEIEELLQRVGMDRVTITEVIGNSSNTQAAEQSESEDFSMNDGKTDRIESETFTTNPEKPAQDKSETGSGGQSAASRCSIALWPGTELDFGAVAKGYLSRVIVEMLENMGVKHALLDLGGNIVTIGTKPDGSDWKVGIKDPFGEKDMIGYVSVSGKSVITSGGYERYFTGEDGEIYWHIIDPKTGYPARTGIVSATIIGDDPLLCDALSTALFVTGPERASEYYETYGGFEYVLVMEDESIIMSEGLADSLVIK